MNLSEQFVEKARKIYGEDFIPLHRPLFIGNEKKYLTECIESNFVSSVGNKVIEFEQMVCDYTGSKYAISAVSGTAALHIALLVSGVSRDHEVLTQSLTFVATCNAISYLDAKPVFIDVDKDSMGMSPTALKNFLEKNAIVENGKAINIKTKRRISACVPMHTYGFPLRIKEIKKICNEWGIALIEDAAESLGSFYKGKHTGTFGKLGVFSFNGNKIITTGGGGVIVTNNKKIAELAKHLTTTAKKQHSYEYVHDRVGFNYRMPNLNAALGCAQLEQLDYFLKSKEKIAEEWEIFFDSLDIKFLKPILYGKTNNWLCCILLNSKEERDRFLVETNNMGVMTRPAWRLMNQLNMYNKCTKDSLKNSIWLENRMVNIPSSAIDI